MPRLKINLHLALLLAFTALALAPLTAPGYFMSAHDARHTVYFMQMFDAALRDGALYPRWATDMVFGYGYPLWLILAPLPYYVAEFFHLLGLDFVGAVKALDAVALVASGVAMYLFAARVLGQDAGLVAAVAYLFIPYHLVDLYVRGAAAEFLAFAFSPLILWALHKLVTTRRAFYVPITALAYAGLILTHAQLALLFSPLLGAYGLLLWFLPSPAPRGRGWWILMPPLALFWGALLAATFILPIAFEQRYLTSEPLIGGFFDFHQHFIFLSQLLSPFWGYGYAGINGTDQFSLQLGIMPLLLTFVALFAARARGSAVRAHLVFFALITVAAIFMMLSGSAPLWELFSSLVVFIQFPWRLLIVTALTLAFLAGAAVHAVPKRDAFPSALWFSLLLVVALFPHAQPRYTDAVFTYNTLMDFEVRDRELLGDTVWTQKRPQDSPLVAQYRAGRLTQKAVALDDGAAVELLAHHSQWDEVRVTADKPTRLLFYTRYFPGWTATVDGAPAALEPYGEQGLMLVQVAAGTRVVRVSFGDTPPRQLGALLSLLSLIGAGVWLWRTRRSAWE